MEKIKDFLATAAVCAFNVMLIMIPVAISIKLFLWIIK
jgi:hypothetical protein